MPGSMRTDGTEELAAMLGQLGEEAEHIAKHALYEGAAVVANAYKSAASRIVTSARRYHNEPGGRLPTPEEKAAVMNIGIANFKGDGGSEVDTLIGMPEGYAMINGRRKAVKLIARSINSGTSFMKKQPVFRRAASSSRGAAQQAMIAAADEMINKIIK